MRRVLPLVLGAAALALAMPAAAQSPLPQSYVLLIHGGAWVRVGAGPTAHMDPIARRLQRWGYGTVNVNYRAGRYAFGDVERAYEGLRLEVGPHARICLYGSSAGAQMALMLALRHHDVACVVAQSPPSLLDKLRPTLRRHAKEAFPGHGQLKVWSPARHVLHTPALLEAGRRDHVVPLRQVRAEHAAAPHSKLLILAHGSHHWVHTSVAGAALARAVRAERVFLRRSLG
jgi:acetyl esterase/lipase